MRDAQQCRQIGVAAALLNHTLTSIHQHDGEVGCGCPGDHVPGVLHVAGRIGHDELAARGGEIAVGHVDGDALLAFGPQAVGQVGQIDLAAAGDVRRSFQGLDLVFHQVLGVIEQAADQGGFAVVNTAAGVEAQKFDGVWVGHGSRGQIAVGDFKFGRVLKGSGRKTDGLIGLPFQVVFRMDLSM